MTVTINLPADLESALRQQAARSGQDISTFVLDAVKEKIAKVRTFDEICAPFAQAVATAAVSDEEFDEFFEEAREEGWRAKHGKTR